MDLSSRVPRGGFRDALDKDPLSYEALRTSADHILQRTEVRPTVGIVCGSGLGGLASLVSKATKFKYSEIPGFGTSTAPGHKGVLVVGLLNETPVVIMQGRLHAYEGHPLWRATLPIRVMKLLGVRSMIITNAVGGLNAEYQVGDIMLVKDHINMFGLAGENPLRGPNDHQFGPRFFEVNNLYDSEYRKLAKLAAEEEGIAKSTREGVLTISGGPNFESVAELKMMRILGADCVGMSSIPESLVAYHCGMRVLAFSLVTNICTMEYGSGEPPNDQEVLQAAAQQEKSLKRFVCNVVAKIENCTSTVS